MDGLEHTSLVVCDAGPLIHLEELGCLDLLRDFTEVRVADAVWREVQTHRPSALRRPTVKLNRIIQLPKASEELIDLAHNYLLHPGELESLVIMQQSGGAILLTDDAAARLVAERMSYEVHGTLGIIVRALRRQQRTKRQVLNLLRSVPRRSSLFIEPRLLKSVTEQVERA